MNRRELLRRGLGAALGHVALRGLAGCGDDLDDTFDGVAIADGVCVSVHDAVGGEALMLLESAPGLHATIWVDDAAPQDVQLDARGMARVVLTGLSGRTHVYAVELAAVVGAGDTIDVAGVFRTMPVGDGPDMAVRCAISADIGPDLDYVEIFDHVPGDLDFVVTLGDWPYADKAPAATTLDEFIVKHRAARQPQALRRLLARTTLFATYDDHDVTNNWDAATSPALVEAALEAWDLHFPRRDMSRVYRSWRCGAAEFFLLDTRRYRSANDAPDDGTKTMLGAAQLAWLLDGVAASTARWCVVLSSVPLDFVQSVDTWESFARERDLVRDALDPTRVIVVSGDQHYVAKHVHASGLREYVCGPLAAGLGSLPDPVPPEVEVLIATRNFLLVEIADSPTPTLTLSAVSGDGEVVMRETLPA